MAEKIYWCCVVVFVELVLVLSGCESSTNEFSVPMLMQMNINKACDEIYVVREEPPRILHFNPRLRGDWSGKPVIEQNTCYRMQWGSALRCEGWKSRADEETG